MRHSVITGVAGFLGSHLADYLLARDETITGWDNLSTGQVGNLVAARRYRRFYPIFSAIEADRVAFEAAVRNADAVYHFAAAVGVDVILQYPVQSMRTNIALAELVIETCAKYNKPLFLASTSEVYGKATRIPFKENDDVIYGSTAKMRWSYAMAKAIDEFYLLSYVHTHGLPGVVGRFFNLSGPRQIPYFGMVLPRFIKQAIAGEPITVYGDGTQRRCFTHVADLIPAIVHLLHNPKAIGEVVNLGNAEEITIAELARRVKDFTGSDSPIHYYPYETVYRDGFEDTMRRVPDLTKARELADFQPTLGIDQIIADVYEHVRQYGS